MCVSLATIATIASIAGGAASVANAFSQKAKTADSQPAATPATPTAQADKVPDQAAVRKAATGVAGGTTASDTLLAGNSGVDPLSLNLGKNKALGEGATILG